MIRVCDEPPSAPHLIEAAFTALRAFAPQLETLDAARFAKIITQALPDHIDAFQALIQKSYQAQLDTLAFAATQSSDTEPSPERNAMFSDPAWSALPFFRLIKSQYLVWSNFLDTLPDALELEGENRKYVRFVLQQWRAAIAPTNYLPLNPQAIRKAALTQGASLASGAQRLAQDLTKGRVSMSDSGAFELGRSLAATPGDVIFENDLIQLIQYRPTTAQVSTQPLLIVPPFINKYYVLDLRPENSLVRDAVSRGQQVFMISWRNIGEPQKHATWDDYIARGVTESLETVLAIAQVESLNLLGFCVGGTLAACATAIDATRDRPRIHSLTLLATLLDFQDTGDISVFIDEKYVKHCETQYAQGGIVSGAQLAAAFASLRPRDLLWHFFEHSYLLDETPAAFDLLFWNDDSANLPGPLFAYYLRNMYLENRLRSPLALRMCDTAIDLNRIQIPTYVLAAKDDHIVPWQSALASARLLGKHPKFVLTESGHIAGVVNPPSAKRRGYWRDGADTQSHQRWIDSAQYIAGSWWDDWHTWLHDVAGLMQSAPKRSGNRKFKPIEAAPGRYVRESPAVASQ